MARALGWEQWRLMRRRLLSVSMGSLGIAGLLLRYTPPQTALEDRALFFGVLMMQIPMTVVLLLQARDPGVSGAGFDRRLYRLPISTRDLVTWRLLSLVLATAAVSLAVVSLARLVFGATWSPWPAVLAGAVAMAWAGAVFWTLAATPVVCLVVAGASFGGFAWWLAWWVGFGQGAASTGLRMTVAPPLIGVSALVLAFGLAVWSVSRDRRGLPVIPTAPLGHWLAEQIPAFTTRRPLEFRSPMAAQWWLEWRQKGYVMPSYALLTLSVIVVTNTWGGLDTAGMLRMLALFLPLILAIFPPITGALVGRFSTSSENPELDIFRATRPLGDRAMALGFLGSGGAGLALAWLLIALGSGAILAMLWSVGDRAVVEMVWQGLMDRAAELGALKLVLGALAVLVLGWVNMGLVASCFLTGRNTVVGVLVLAPYVILVAVLSFYEPGSSELSVVFVAGSWAIGLAAMAGTAVAFAAARRRGLVPKSWPWLALGAWVAQVLIVAYAGVDVTSLAGAGGLEQGLLVFGLGLLALTTAPVATAPLALAWNRHR